MSSFEFEASGVEIKPEGYKRITVCVEADEDDILDTIGIVHVVSHYNKDELLDLIGVDYVKEYFGLVDAE